MIGILYNYKIFLDIKMSNINKIGILIKQIREKMEITLTALAEASGTDPGHLSRIESGATNPRQETVERLADAFCQQEGVDEALCQKIRRDLVGASGHESPEDDILGRLQRQAVLKIASLLPSVGEQLLGQLAADLPIDAARRLVAGEDPRSISSLNNLLPPEAQFLEGPARSGEFAQTMVIGVDCATDPKNVGIAVAHLREGRLHLEAVTTGAAAGDQALWIASRIEAADRALLALDAPLGWPKALGQALGPHRAGLSIAPPANKMFRRHTDEEIKRRVRKQPLDVGADRIARTAVAALTLLEQIRTATGKEIDLAWSPSFEEPISAIEVYPAATLKMLELPSGRYKNAKDTEVRREIMGGLADHIDGLGEAEEALADADILDAIICAVAGADFLQGIAVPPEVVQLVKREGWIWTR